jgi:uncharacterized protein
MNDDDITAYLKSHPEFFQRQSELLAQITLSSPHGGAAVSLGERQLGVLRDKLRLVEGKLAELIGFGEDNDAIASKVHELSVALIGANSFSDALRALYAHLGGGFAVPHVAVRLWTALPGLEPEFSPVSEAIKSLAASLAHPYCGASDGQETLAWFGERAAHIRSMAQIPLWSDGKCFGLLVLASEEPRRFYPDMGVLYLSRIGEMAAAVLYRVSGG